MKTTIKVTELSHEDIVTILADALYGCDYLQVKNDEEFYEQYENCKNTEGDCIEDKMADVLLNGGKVIITDLEDEEDKELTIYKLLDACSTDEGYDYAKTLLIDEDGDYFTANNLLQLALYGEVVYG